MLLFLPAQWYFRNTGGQFMFSAACFDASRAVVSQRLELHFITLLMIVAQAAWCMVFSSALIGLQVARAHLPKPQHSSPAFPREWFAIPADTSRSFRFHGALVLSDIT